MFKLRTIDVWDTLLRRDCHPECIKVATANHLYLGWSNQLKPECCDIGELYKARLEAERVLAEQARTDGNDDEYEITLVQKQWAITVFAETVPEGLPKHLAEFELSVEIARSYADSEISQFLHSHEAEKTLFLSDFYMGAEMLGRLLSSKGLDKLVPEGISSCDAGFNKRSGRVFPYIHSLYEISPEQHIHIGDNEWSDVLSPKAHGVQTQHYLPKIEHSKRLERESLFASIEALFAHINTECLNAAKEECETLEATQKAAFELGISAAPLFIGFVIWIAEQAILEKLDRVYFQTREGEFFYKIFQILFSNGKHFGHDLPSSDILEVSRLSTFLPSLKDVSIEEMLRIWSFPSHQSVEGLFVTLSIDIMDFTEHLTSIGLKTTDTIYDPKNNPQILQLFKTPEFIQAIKNSHKEQASLLLDYLRHKCMADEQRYGLVDIGWRGTIQDNIAIVMPHTHFHGLYLGLHPFVNQQPKNTTKKSFGPNENFSRKMSSLFSNSAAMELLCNSSLGSVHKYTRVNGHVVPIREFSEEENAAYSEFVCAFQRGVLLSAQTWQGYIQRYAISSGDMHTPAMRIWNKIKTEPDNGLINVFLNSPQNEIFCRGCFLTKNQFPSLSTILFSPIFTSKKREVIDFVRRVQWTEAIKNMKDLSQLHRFVLVIVFYTANFFKRVKFKVRLLKRKLYKSRGIVSKPKFDPSSWHCLEIPSMVTPFKTPLSKSKESLENSRKYHRRPVYKGQNEFGKTRLLTPSVPLKTDSQHDQAQAKDKISQMSRSGSHH